MKIFSVLILLLSSFASTAFSQTEKYPNLSQMVAMASLSVVTIVVSKAAPVSKTDNFERTPSLSKDSVLGDFFSKYFPNDFGKKTRAIGSGFILTEDGEILTAAHLVAKAKKIKVELSDRREFKAVILGIDGDSDLAILKIDAKELQPLELQPNPLPALGEWVVSIGSPFGFKNSISVGVISGLDRLLPVSRDVNYIQTDLSINPGSSGGPILNLDGRVVGMSSRIYSQSGISQGISFALPTKFIVGKIPSIRRGE